MKEQIRSVNDYGKRQAAWIGMSCIGSYCSCYIVKNILSAVMPQMMTESAVDSTALGTAGSVYLLTYGIGQFINGQIGNRVEPLYMVLIGLLLPGMLIACFPFCHSSVIGILLWGICGFTCSMLWGPLSKLIGENTEERYSKLLLSGMIGNTCNLCDRNAVLLAARLSDRIFCGRNLGASDFSVLVFVLSLYA